MAVAVELSITPSLDEVRELAKDHSLVPLRHTFIADCETPVSAYLKLRGDGPSFLLESAEQGQQVGRWSFLGFRPRAVIRLARGEHPDPYRLLDEELARYRIAPLDGLPPFAGGAVGMFGYDLAPTSATRSRSWRTSSWMDIAPVRARPAPSRTAAISSALTARLRERSPRCANGSAGRCRGRGRGELSRPSTARTWARRATRQRSSTPRST